MITISDRRNVYRAARGLGFPLVMVVDGAEAAGELAWLVLCRAGEERWVAYAAAALALARPCNPASRAYTDGGVSGTNMYQREVMP